MDQPLPGTAHEALGIFVGRWLGTTELAASPWGPARTATAEVTFTRAAGGFAVVQSYRHTEADGTHFEGHGVFTVDPDHDETLWYYVDSMGQAAVSPGPWRLARLGPHRGAAQRPRHRPAHLPGGPGHADPHDRTAAGGDPGLPAVHDLDLPPRLK
jgi:hypothetical protein